MKATKPKKKSVVTKYAFTRSELYSRLDEITDELTAIDPMSTAPRDVSDDLDRLVGDLLDVCNDLKAERV